MPQPAGELAVIDGAAPEGRFRKSGLAAVVGNFLQQLLGVHGVLPPAPRSRFGGGRRERRMLKRTNRGQQGQPQLVPRCEWDNMWAIAAHRTTLKQKTNSRELIFCPSRWSNLPQSDPYCPLRANCAR